MLRNTETSRDSVRAMLSLPTTLSIEMTFTTENSKLTISYLEEVLDDTKYRIGHLSLKRKEYLFDSLPLWPLSFNTFSYVPQHWENSKGVAVK